jgi:hemerythrin-like domain-containing protein
VRIPEPASGDVVDVIIEDHRLIEELLRQLRDASGDREAARADLADLLIAHGEAEEQEVYPTLARKRAITKDVVEHGQREHSQANGALLALLECKGTDTARFDKAVEELGAAVYHHLSEEEQGILNSARAEVGAQARAALGKAFLAARNRMLGEGVGSVESARAIVERDARRGRLVEDGDG